VIGGHTLLLVAGALAGGYAVGCIPVAWLVVRRQRGVDLRHTGRGQADTLDTLRVGGVRVAALTIALELVKGAVVGLGASIYDAAPWFAATAIAGCVLGDAFPVGIRRGRRGIVPLVAGVVAALPSAWWAGVVIALPAVVLLGFRGRAYELLVVLCVPLGLLIGTRDLRVLGPAAIIVAALLARNRLRALQQRRDLRRRAELGDLGPPLAVEPPRGGVWSRR
jgi:acyl phosphate:glycerol-3-phosphate acyltransferase